MKHLLAPSILNADFLHLGKDLEMINCSVADWVHLDIMDGMFVPNITFGPPVVAKIRQATQKPLDVHLMIVQPERYFREFRDAGADILTFHYEASTHLHRSVQLVKTLGMKAGVVLNPHSPVSLLSDILPDLDMVLLMSVNPGFGGQQFIEGTYRKIESLRKIIDTSRLSALIEVDGGINTGNAARLVSSGADVLVAGNVIFSSPDPLGMIGKLKHP